MQLAERPEVFAGQRQAHACAHCGLDVPASRRASAFCCHGCETVYGLLHAQHLERFYDFGGGRGYPVGLAPEPATRPWLGELEQAGDLGDGRSRVVVDVQGIHCAACVWVLQELWRRRGGRQCRINPALGQAELVYARDRLPLAAFLDDVERLGYRVAPASKRDRKGDHGLLLRMGVCVALAMNAMMFAASEYFGLTAGGGQPFRLFRGMGALLAALAVAVGGPVFFAAAWTGLRRRVLHLDLPIALGIALAFAGSLLAWLSGRGDAYFDTVTVFVALMLLGRYLQQRAVARNREYLLADDGLLHVRLRRVRGTGIDLVGADAIVAGDILLLLPGDLLPVRARLLDDRAAFSLDWIDGESQPRAFAAGDVVPAGAFQAGRRPQRLEALADVHASGLVALLQRSTSDRDDLGGAGRFWQRWNRGYVAAVLVLAAAAIVLWSFLDPTKALSVGVAVLVVTCPCAIGIATPLAFELAVAALRRRGVLACSSGLLEKACRVRKVILDKTGTVSWGRMRVEPIEPPPAALLDVVLAMAASSNHPVSRAIVEAMAPGARLPVLEGAVLEEVPGSGVELHAGGRVYRLGSPRYVAGVAASAPGECWFAEDGAVRARFRAHEDLREGFAAEVQRLVALGREVHVLSGDRQARVDEVARVLGIPRERARGDMSPEAKASYVRALDRSDTMMLGDGLNDAPAFAAAYVAGTPALDRPVLPARADFCYAGGRPEAVGEVLALAGRWHRTVRTNLRLGLAYNAVAVSLAFAGRMSPVLCAVLMPISSLLLIAHTTWRLRRPLQRSA